MNIYTVILMITTFVLAVTAADVLTNRLVSAKNKREIVILCALIFTAALFEYIGSRTNGAAVEFINLHKTAKLVEFCTAPCIGVAAANAYGKIKNKKFAEIFISAHIVFEIVAFFNCWVFRIDAQNVYHRQKLYWVYIMVFMFATVYCYVCVMNGNKQYQARLGIVNIMILAFLTFGIGIQMVYSSIMVDFLCVSIGSFALYHYRGNIINQIDITTRLFNRRCFERSMENIKSPSYIVVFDIDNFKLINDTYGHTEGDVCLRSVADRIIGVYGKYGSCYRIGGDEFCVILFKNMDNLQNLNCRFREKTAELNEKYGDVFGVSLGYSRYDKNVSTTDQAFKNADETMYANKRKMR